MKRNVFDMNPGMIRYNSYTRMIEFVLYVKYGHYKMPENQFNESDRLNASFIDVAWLVNGRTICRCGYLRNSMMDFIE